MDAKQTTLDTLIERLNDEDVLTPFASAIQRYPNEPILNLVEISLGSPQEAADELAALRAQLSTAQAEVERYRAAQCLPAPPGPESKPVEGSDVAWDNLKEGREMSIASAHYVYGEDLARWDTAQIARQALDETVTPKDAPNRGGDVANGAKKEDSQP